MRISKKYTPFGRFTPFNDRGVRFFMVKISCLFVLVSALSFFVTSASAQVTSPATINGAFPVGAPNSNLAGTSTNSNTTGVMTNLGSNQGNGFTFTGDPVGAGANWNGGFYFLNAQTLQVQAQNTAIAAGNYVDYTIDFNDTASVVNEIYGIRFTMGGFDNGDQTTISFYRNNVLVPVSVSTYVNGVVTAANPNNVITFAGTNIDIVGSSGSIIVDGDGNNDAGSLFPSHGAQEQFTLALPLNVIVDEVRFEKTGKNINSTGNVTLFFGGFAWARPGVAITKSSSFSQGSNSQSNIGDVITYNYVVHNTGNVPLANPALTETTFTGSGTTPAPTFLSGTGGATASLMPSGSTATFQATYSVTASDLLAGFVDNQATVSTLPVGGTLGIDNVADLSDSGNAGDGGTVSNLTEDDVTTTTFPTPIVFNPSINARKSADISGFSSPVMAGDVITYTIEVENTGDVALSGVILDDTLTNANGDILALAAPSFDGATLGSSAGNLVVNEIATYTVSYTLLQQDIDAEGLSNTVRVDANAFSGGTIFDISDDNDDLDGNTTNDPTITPLPGAPSLLIEKTYSPIQTFSVGETVTYTFRVRNSGNQTITNVNVIDAHNGFNPVQPIPLGEIILTGDDAAPLGDSSDVTANNGEWSSLAPGDTVTLTATYEVVQSDIDLLQ